MPNKHPVVNALEWAGAIVSLAAVALSFGTIFQNARRDMKSYAEDRVARL